MENALPETVDLARIEDILYWSKKWEISPNQLLQAVRATNSNKAETLAAYLRQIGFAL